MKKNITEKVEELTKNIVQDFLTQLGLDADVTVSFPESGETDSGSKGSDFDYVKVELTGENLGEIIGYRGNILESSQTILGLILAKTLLKEKIEEKFRFLLDVNQYKAQREKYLISHAERAAEEVRNSGQPMELAPMSPSERRIIHIALRNQEGVETTSVGEGENRRVAINPN